MEYCECDWCEGHRSPEEEAEYQERAKKLRAESNLVIDMRDYDPALVRERLPIGFRRSFDQDEGEREVISFNEESGHVTFGPIIAT